MNDSDRAAILVRRRRFILLALTGVAGPATACSQPESCLSIRDPRSSVDPGLDPLTTVCPAEIGEPVSLLQGSQIRLPKGVTADAIIEVPPDSVRLTIPVESVSCIHDMPGGIIFYFAMTAVPDDPSKSMTAVRDELLKLYGYDAPRFSNERIDEVMRSYEVIIDHPPTRPNGEPARAFLRMTANAGRIYAVVYEVHPNAWNALQASLRASAASISFSPP
jgi:hypothetical protein